jgi:hypothetical protein
MELVSHIANATFSSLIQNKTKQSKCLKNTAFKQKTFQIVKERTMREASRDHSNSPSAEANMGSSHRAIVCMTRQVICGSWWSQPGSNR